MTWLTPRRVETEELLDAADAPHEDVERSLRDLRWINRYCCGIDVYRRLLKRFTPDSVLDIGTGTSDLLETAEHVRLRIGLDFKIEHLLFMRNGSRVHRVVGDATRLPFREDAVDVVTSAHFLHHFSPAENRGILTDALRVARQGVAVNDTQRSYAPLLFVKLLGALGLFGRITVYDAPASVTQGYTADEARAIAASVPAARSEVRRVWPFRIGILLWKKRN